MRILSDRMLRIEGSAEHSRLYRPLRSLEQFRTQGFLRIEPTAVQKVCS